jgi:hypothetical protein
MARLLRLRSPVNAGGWRGHGKFSYTVAMVADREGIMRAGWHSAWAAIGAIVFLLADPGALSAAPCDQYDPAAPVRTARITLSSSDSVDEQRDELRSFVATGSLGHVDARLLSSVPRGAVRSFFAGPLVSRHSPNYGEELKGIAVSVTVQPGRRPVSVVIGLRQVCAQYFRNSFLYY